MRLHKLGNDFTKQFMINLLPGVEIDRGYYSCVITYMTTTPANPNELTINHSDFSFFFGNKSELDCVVGGDVVNIIVTIAAIAHNNIYKNTKSTSYHYNHLVSTLLLFNIAERLINS